MKEVPVPPENPPFKHKSMNVIQIDQADAELARQVMEVSPVSSYSQPHVDNLKDSMRSENFFLSKMNQSASASHEDLHNIDGDPEVLAQLNKLNCQPMASPHNLINTTPMSQDGTDQKIKIEICGRPQEPR